MAESLKWDESIIKVLKDKGDRMRYDDIANAIVEQKLRTNVGATPANTVNSILHGDKLKKKVVSLGAGVYILKSVLEENPSLAAAKSSSNEDTQEEQNVEDALITAYGRFWDRKLMEDNDGHLYGSSTKTKNATGIDFANYAGIYLLHKGYEVIYVGQASKLSERLMAHTSDDKRNRWDNFSWFCIDEYEKQEEQQKAANKSMKNDALLDTLEAMLIETLGPERNKKVGNGFEDKEFEQNTAKEFLKSKK